MAAEGRTIRLTIAQRYALSRILPQDGEFWEMRSVRSLRKMLKTTDEERKPCKVAEHPTNGTVQFEDESKIEAYLAQEADFKFYPSGLKLIRDTLTKMDKDKKMAPDDLVALYEKFMPEDQIKAEEPMGERC